MEGQGRRDRPRQLARRVGSLIGTIEGWCRSGVPNFAQAQPPTFPAAERNQVAAR